MSIRGLLAHLCHFADAPETPIRWTQLQRAAFRFVFVYLLLYIFPAPLSYIPLVGPWIGQVWNDLVAPLVKWTGTTVFGVQITVMPNGSGDTTFNYVQVFLFLVVSLIAAAAWTAVDFRRLNYRLLHGALRIYVRYTLGLILISYGMAKIIKTQFPSPNAYRLTETFGDASPMGLLWAFMGYSVGYNIFAGLGEAVAGALLFYRRTTLLGSVLAIGVMSNVVALNYFYDVPVKLFSTHLLLQALFLMAPDLGRVMRLLVLNRPVAPSPRLSAFTVPWLHWPWFGVKSMLLGGFLLFGLMGALQTYRLYGDGAKPTPLAGLYDIQSFEIDGQERPPLTTDDERWRDVIITNIPFMEKQGSFRVRAMSHKTVWYRYSLDESAKALKLTPATQAAPSPEEPPTEFTLSYTEPQEGMLALEGEIDGKAVRATLSIRPLDDFILTSRGYHWINEYPYNR